MSVNKLLVAGAGQMGAGIVQVSAVAGLDVVMIDVADEFIQRGMAGVEKGLGRLVDKGRMEAAARDAALARITTSTDMAAGADADLFLEVMGPLALADPVGLDTTKTVLETFERELSDAGFYDYAK